MHKFLSTSAIALASVFFANSALAADINQGDPTATNYVAPAQFDGAYVALGGGYVSHDVWGEFNDIQSTPDFAVTGFFATGRVGYDKQIGDFVVGGFGEINYHTLEFAGQSIDEIDFEYVAGVRGGVVVGQSLLYANGGYSWMPVDVPGLDLNGPFAGLGIETKLGGGFNLALEGRHTWRSDDVDAACVSVGGGHFLIDEVKDNAWSGRAVLVRRF